MNIPQYQPIDYTQHYNRMGAIAGGAVQSVGGTVQRVLDEKDLKKSKAAVWTTIESDMKENGATAGEMDVARKTLDSVNDKNQLHNYMGAYATNSQMYKAIISRYGEEKKNKFPRPTLGFSDDAYSKYLTLYTGLEDKAQKIEEEKKKTQSVQGLARDTLGGQGVAAMQSAAAEIPSGTPEEQLPGATPAGRTLGAPTPVGQYPGLTPQGQTLGMPAGREPALQPPSETPPSAQELAASAQPEQPDYSATQIAAAGAERGVGGEPAIKSMVESAKAEDAQKLKQQQYELQVQKWADLESRRNKDLDLIDAKIADLKTHPERFNRFQLDQESKIIIQFKNIADKNLKESQSYVQILKKALSQIHGKGIEGVILAELQAKSGQKNFDEEWLTNEISSAETDLTLQKEDSGLIDEAFRNFQSEIAKQHTLTGKSLRDAKAKRAKESVATPSVDPAAAPPAPAAPSAPAGSPVGTVKPGRTGTYKKINDGPDTDMNNWQKVT